MVHLSRYVTSHSGQLSLVIPSWVGAMSTSQRAVMPCGWIVKAGMVRVWVASKTMWSPCYTRPISERFRDNELIYKAVYKFAFFTFFYFYTIKMYACMHVSWCIRPGHNLDLWPLTLKTFSAIATHIIYICAQFHWNTPPLSTEIFTDREGFTWPNFRILEPLHISETAGARNFTFGT